MKPWVKFGLLWAVWMIIFMTFISPYIRVWFGFDEVPEKQTAAKIIIYSICFIIAGLVVAYINRNKKKPKKQIDA